MSAADINYVNGAKVTGTMVDVCIIAENLLDWSGARVMYGPDKAVDDCGIPELEKWPGHEDHFHLQW